MKYLKRMSQSKVFWFSCQFIVCLILVFPISLNAVDNKNVGRWSTQWPTAKTSGQGAYGNLFQIASGETYVVQCHYQSSKVFREIMKKAGAKIISYIPQETFIIQSNQKTVNIISGLSMVRWVEPFEPGYKLSQELLSKLLKRNLAGLQIQNPYLLSLYATDETSLKEIGQFVEKVTGRYHYFNGKDFGVRLGDRELFKVISHHNVQFIDEVPTAAVALGKRKAKMGTLSR